ncbi:potassium transporter TrkG [Haloechinothrix sp. LS1_15]|uniref:TrkH family potassium uptake protein n=1 Tax=Haloechinothrix sp. LS1_15 TaxID=2652248 RepID=UPI0029458567|nr:potassium transporter TrkG [Haloechinothrix sp. LS1_15]MDV6011469.1 TrkH family potassium uptake protein [Haloechinothrix sp. LS1_15]
MRSEHPNVPGPPRGRVRTALRKALPTGGHPARAVLGGFAIAIGIGTVLLALPAASEEPGSAGFVTALFTATSAVCITGLIVVDTGEYWTTFGEIVILAMIQLGGIGIMTAASLLVLLVSRRFGLGLQLSAQRETKSLQLGEVRSVTAGIVKISLTVEAIVALLFTGRLLAAYDYAFGEALYTGIFHGISAFNNAGFSLYHDSMSRFVNDPWISLPVIIAVILGGLGFPVIFEVARRLRKRDGKRWSIHTKITLLTSGVLLAIGFLFITLAEWNNQDTMGPLGVGGKLLAGLFAATMPRSAGFNSVETGDMQGHTLLVIDVLMFIGGGSASTAAGIKVTTFALLAYVILAEIRGEPTVHVMGRRLAASVQRQALTIALLTVALVMITTITMQAATDFPLDKVLFESVSAVNNVGLSTGITADLPAGVHVMMSVLMFIGRLGPITLATALALRDRPRRYELPEERPIVG